MRYMPERLSFDSFLSSAVDETYKQLAIWGHGWEHIDAVWTRACILAQCFSSIDLGLLRLVIVCHDVGLIESYVKHHEIGAQFVKDEARFAEWFTDACIQMASDAVLTHRSSNCETPNSVYGCIVADADRDVDPVEVTLRFMLSNHVNESGLVVLPSFDETYYMMCNKYGKEGRGNNLWLNHPLQVEGLERIKHAIHSRTAFLNVREKALCKAADIIYNEGLRWRIRD